MKLASTFMKDCIVLGINDNDPGRIEDFFGMPDQKKKKIATILKGKKLT